jgi:hypothetical protein
VNRITHLHKHILHQLRRHRYLGARAELDHAQPVAGVHVFLRFQPADDAPRDGAGDLLDAHQAAGLGVDEIDPELLVADGAVGGAGVEERAGIVAQGGDAAATCAKAVQLANCISSSLVQNSQKEQKNDK